MEKSKTNYLLSDLGIVIFLICVLIGAIIVSRSLPEEMTLNVIMFGTIILLSFFAAFKFYSIAVSIAAIQVFSFTAYTVFMAVNRNLQISLVSYAWLVLPIGAVGGMILFMNTSHSLEKINKMLSLQVQNLVMVDPLTGHYNLRSMYNDMQKQFSYSNRNNVAFTLMIIKLRYVEEIKKIISRNEFDFLKQRVVMVVEDCLRKEDRLYVIDNDASMGLLLTCGEEGAAIIKTRIKKALSDKENFCEFMDTPIKIDTKIAYIEYSKEIYQNDHISFKQKVESELQYDV